MAVAASTRIAQRAPDREEWLEVVETDVGSRLDRLPFRRWHVHVLAALGLVWILDGLEATIVGSVAARLTAEATLNLTTTKVGIAASIYIAGAAVGALLFGWLNDRIGRRRTFLLTLSLYLAGTLATATAFSFWSFAVFRFITGLGIGGEYVAVNSAIGEVVPARWRGWAYIAVNGSWWLGATAGALLSLLLLEPGLLPADLGWRLAFALGAVLGVAIVVIRRTLPESPRWLAVHGRADTARDLVDDIERRVAADGEDLPPAGTVRVRQRRSTGVREVARRLAHTHRRRALLAFALMVSQAFFYNAVFYTHGIVLTDFHGVSADDVGMHLAPLALGNFAGAVILGPLFDALGRRWMLTATYGLAGVLLAGTAFVFEANVLGSWGMTGAWTAVFFLASAAASAGYLTISELFPVEMRGMAIAIFYAVSTGAGGVTGPALFGVLLSDRSRDAIFAGYLFAAGLMAAAALVAAWLAVPAERRSLEEVSPPLGSQPAPANTATTSP